MQRQLLALVVSCCIAACGGDSDQPGNPDAQVLAKRAGQEAVVSAVDPGIFTRQRALAVQPVGTPEEVATRLFELGESTYASYFPSHRPSQFVPSDYGPVVGGFWYRFYPETGTYLAVDRKSQGVYVLGGAFGSKVLYVGLASKFLECTPVATGFDIKKLETAAGPGDSADGGAGVGSSGSEGAIRGADVNLYDAEGRLLGSAKSDERGLATLKACGASGPFLIEYVGNADSYYFDEGIAFRDNQEPYAFRPFPPGDRLSARVVDLKSHVAVTPITHIAALELAPGGGGGEAVRGRDRGTLGNRKDGAAGAGPLPSSVSNAPVTAAAVRAANEKTRLLFNQMFAGSGLALDDITKVPPDLAYGIDSMRSYGKDQRGQYAQMLSSLAKTAAQTNRELTNPAREITRQLARDLSDGAIDGKDVSGVAVAEPNQVAYDAQRIKATVVEQAAGRLTTVALGQGSVSIASSTQAQVSCGSGGGQCFPFGAIVTLRAQAASGWTFLGWSDADACTDPRNCQTATKRVTLSGDKIMTAIFDTVGPQLAVAKVGAGTVASTPTGIDCGLTCNAKFPEGTAVTLVAKAAFGSTFLGWTGASCGQSSSCTVTADTARTVGATFGTGVVLTVLKAGEGSGTVSTEQPAINCGNACTATFPAGASVTLLARAAAGSSFIGWSEPSCQGSSCTVSMSRARSVTATFGADPTLTVTRLGAGTGTVASSGAEISCGGICSRAFALGAQVVLVATPSLGATFTGWGGACSGLNATCTVTMDGAKSVTASFGLAPTFNLAVTAQGLGTVSSSPAGISNCYNGTCSAAYPQGASVTLLATPGPGATFIGWSGDCSGTGDCTVTLSASRNVSASFSAGGFVVSGTISGLVSAPIQLSTNGQILDVPAGSTSFTFPPLAAGTSYNVVVSYLAIGETCDVRNGAGTITNGPVTNVAINCGFLLGGSVTGLAGSGLVLASNGQTVAVGAGASAFQFPVRLAYGTNYNVTVQVQPVGQTCTVTNGTGLIGVIGTILQDPVSVTCGAAGGVTVSTLAGSGDFGFADGTGTAAQFNGPNGVAVDASGNLYVADVANSRIRKISPTGVVTTFAGSGVPGFLNGTGTAAQFNQPFGVAVDASGNVYVADASNHRIRKITSAGVVSTLAGSGVAGFLNGTGTAAQFNTPKSVTVDASGNLYVADASNHRIRKITSVGVVTTLAGSGVAGFLNGTGTAAQFFDPSGVAVDASGSVFVGDLINNRIRKISPTGVVTTLAGSGAYGRLDGTGTAASFAGPHGVAVDSGGNVYVAEYFGDRIRKISPSGVVTTLAGSGVSGFLNGAGTVAQFWGPTGIAVDVSGNVFVGDYTNDLIRKISPN